MIVHKRLLSPCVSYNIAELLKAYEKNQLSGGDYVGFLYLPHSLIIFMHIEPCIVVPPWVLPATSLEYCSITYLKAKYTAECPIFMNSFVENHQIVQNGPHVEQTDRCSSRPGLQGSTQFSYMSSSFKIQTCRKTNEKARSDSL